MAIRILKQSQNVVKVKRIRTKDKSIRMLLEMTIQQVKFKHPIPPRRKIMFIVSAGSSIYECKNIVDSESGKFPLEPIVFDEDVKMIVRFRKDESESEDHQKRNGGIPNFGNGSVEGGDGTAIVPSVGKSPQKSHLPPTILTISIFAVKTEETRWTAQDLVGQWVCGQTWSDRTFVFPNHTDVHAFWKSIDGQVEMKNCRLFGNNQLETGELEFKSILKEKTYTENSSKTDVLFGLTEANKNRLKAQVLLEKKMKKKGEKSLKRLIQGIELSKFTFNDVTPTKHKVKLFYRPNQHIKSLNQVDSHDKQDLIGILFWSSINKHIEDEEHSLPIQKITDILVGTVHSPFPVETDPEKTFSLLSPEGSLNLIADTVEQVDYCVSALQHLFKQMGRDVLK